MMPRCLAQPCPLSLYALPAHPVVCGLYPLGDLCLEWFAGLSCMMPRCLAQPWKSPLPLYALPAHTVVYLCQVAGYGGIRSFPS